MQSEREAERRVSSIMTAQPVAVTRDSTLDEAQAIMDEHQIRHLPVLAEGRLVGVLSDRDALEATGWLPARVHAARGGTLPDKVPRHVRDIVHQPAHYVKPEDSLSTAALELLHRRIGCVPVVDHGVLVGIVSEMDLLNAYVAEFANDSSSTESQVARHMTGAPTTIHWYTSLGSAIELCRANDIRHLPVLEGDDLVGLVSDRDLRRAVGSGRHEEMPVDEIVTRKVVTVPADASMVRAARVMADGRFSSLPVVDGRSLVGILTLTDVLERCLDVARERD